MRDGRTVRLRTIGAGTSVGEISLYLGGAASASVLTDLPGHVYLLVREKLEEIEANHPALALKFHHYIISLLDQRLQNTTASVQVWMDDT